VPLLLTDQTLYKDVIHYQQLPIFVNDVLTAQTLGQWVYFRQNNIYTKQSILANDTLTIRDYNNYDVPKNFLNVSCGNLIFNQNNKQLGLAPKQLQDNSTNILGFISSTGVIYNSFNSNTDITLNNFIYSEQKNDLTNNTVIYES
jgi:hypothetical protein